MKRHMDFFFFIGSVYAYLAAMRIDELASRAGVAVNWRPFSVRDIMVEQNNLPRNQPAKIAYMWRDSERRARRNGVPYAGRPPYPIDPEQRANRVATLAKTEGWCEDFSRAAFRAWFLDGVTVGAPGTLEPIIAALGHDPAQVLARADDNGLGCCMPRRLMSRVGQAGLARPHLLWTARCSGVMTGWKKQLPGRLAATLPSAERPQVAQQRFSEVNYGGQPSNRAAVPSSVMRPEIQLPLSAAPMARIFCLAHADADRRAAAAGRTSSTLATRSLVRPSIRSPSPSKAQPTISPTAPALVQRLQLHAR